MAEAFSVGIQPDQFWRMNMRELYACFAGEAKTRVRQRQLHLWQAWMTANFTNAKRLPALEPLLRKLEPRRAMSNRAVRSTLVGMAQAMGARIVRRKKGEG